MLYSKILKVLGEKNEKINGAMVVFCDKFCNGAYFCIILHYCELSGCNTICMWKIILILIR